MSAPTQPAPVAPAPVVPMDQQDLDFGYHPVGSTPESLEMDRKRREAQTFAYQLKQNLPMTVAASGVCGVLLYGLWKSLLSSDDHKQGSKAQAKWMGFRVLAQGLTFGGLFGMALYSGRLFSQPEHPLIKASKI